MLSALFRASGTLTDGITHGNRRYEHSVPKKEKNEGGNISPVPHSLEALRLFDRRDISTKASASAGAAR